MTRALIAIDGIDGSGKSTFARGLLAGLAARGAGGAIISVDEFRRPVDWSRAASEADVYYDGYYDLAHCERCLAAFVRGDAGCAIPQFDPVTERLRGERAVDFSAAAVVIVEGVFPLRLPSLAGGIVIYLDASAAEARRRIIGRDLRKGRTREEIERRIERRYAPGQARYHAAFDPRGRADIIVDNERPAAACALRRDLSRVPPELRALLDAALPK